MSLNELPHFPAYSAVFYVSGRLSLYIYIENFNSPWDLLLCAGWRVHKKCIKLNFFNYAASWAPVVYYLEHGIIRSCYMVFCNVLWWYPAYSIFYLILNFRRHNKSLLPKEQRYYTEYCIIIIIFTHNDKIPYVESILRFLLYIG